MCIRRRRVIELTLRDASLAEVRPLGLILKAGSWFVVDGGQPVEVVPIDDLVATRMTRQEFEIPAGFSLATFWGERRRAAAPDPSNGNPRVSA